MKKITFLLCATLLCVFLFGGCGSKEEKESGISLYYLNNEGTGLMTISYDISASTTYDRVGELLEKLSEELVDVDYHTPISSGISVTEYEIEDELLNLHFNEEYNTLTDTNEALLRAAVVKTLTQIEGISSVAFYIGNSPLLDASDNPVGAMTDDSFLYDYGQAQSQSESITLMLYYATTDGNNLKSVAKQAHFSSTLPVEQVVMNCLVEAPEKEGLMSAIPEGTKILSVIINEGTCYVTLDSAFLNLPEGESREVAIYSIVNSLCELDTVSKVQIMVNSDSDTSLVDNDMVSGTYTSNFDVVIE